MSSEDSEPSVFESVGEAVSEKFHDLPASTHSDPPEDPAHPPSKTRLFNRDRSLHSILGGGKTADSFLWRDKLLTVGILGGATIAYFFFEHSGYTFLTITANLLLISFAVLFVWSNAALFLNRSPPPLPDLQISEECATKLARALRLEINRVLGVAHEIALGKDFKKFLKVVVVLWGLSVVGGWFHFLTLAYICVVAAHSIPVLYERYEDQVEFYAKRACEEGNKHYGKLSAAIFSRLPKGKKTQ